MSHIGNKPGAEGHPLEKYGDGGGGCTVSSPIKLENGIVRGFCVRANPYVEFLWCLLGLLVVLHEGNELGF